MTCRCGDQAILLVHSCKVNDEVVISMNIYVSGPNWVRFEAIESAAFTTSSDILLLGIGNRPDCCCAPSSALWHDQISDSAKPEFQSDKTAICQT
jgi:hypothetical protein